MLFIQYPVGQHISTWSLQHSRDLRTGMTSIVTVHVSYLMHKFVPSWIFSHLIASSLHGVCQSPGLADLLNTRNMLHEYMAFQISTKLGLERAHLTLELRVLAALVALVLVEPPLVPIFTTTWAREMLLSIDAPSANAWRVRRGLRPIFCKIKTIVFINTRSNSSMLPLN